MLYRIPERLLNRDHVHVYLEDDVINIDLSQYIKDELAKWPQDKVYDILDDIEVSVENIGLYRPSTKEALEKIYQTVLYTLNQIY